MSNTFPQFTVGLVQEVASLFVIEENVSRAVAGVRRAHERGAQIVCLQELFNAPYFCKSLDINWFDLAEPIPGPTTDRMQALASELAVVLIVPLYERQAAGLYRNSAAIIDADGSLLGVYRKMHIPHDPLFEEKYYFTPGDAGDTAPRVVAKSRDRDGFRVWKTRYGTIGVLICWDQWYPEGARITALLGADILFYPTAIGWHPAEKAAFGDDQLTAWRTIQRSHAIANGVFVASPNRVGFEAQPGTGGIEFFGHSVIYDPFGRILSEASSEPDVLVATCDPSRIEETRRNWPFLRDRRVDAYGGIGGAVSRMMPPFRMPAEWEPHTATWLAWPHHEPDWPGKLAPIPWVYAEIVRVLHRHERVDVLCHDDAVREDARTRLQAHDCNPAAYRLHLVPNDRVWLRDSAPTAVHDDAGTVVLANWAFNAWAKYDNYASDAEVGRAVARLTGHARLEPQRPDGAGPAVLEGGAIETNGAGLLLVTEECLLSPIQERNPGLTRAGYETLFRDTLGVRETIWLGEGCVGDDTHGHIDDIARFVDTDTVVLAHEPDPTDENHKRSLDNLRRLTLAAHGGLRVITLPYPRPVIMDGQRLPASYANFYVANGVVIVPTFNDANDRIALNTLSECFPDRTVVGIHSVDLVWGLGTLHCLTQQEPAAAP